MGSWCEHSDCVARVSSVARSGTFSIGCSLGGLIVLSRSLVLFSIRYCCSGPWCPISGWYNNNNNNNRRLQGYKESNVLPPPCQRVKVESASGQPGESRPRSLSYEVNSSVITPPGGFPVGYIVIEARTRSPHEGVARSSSHESDPEGFASDRAMEARLGGRG